MASWRAVNVSVEQPSSREPGAAAAPDLAPGARALRRRLGSWRTSRRALEACTGAKVGSWLARTAAIPFVIGGLYTARPMTEALDGILRVALWCFSFCAVLAALSAAGPAHLVALDQSRGLFNARGIPMSLVRAERSMGLVAWVLRRLTPLALLVLIGCAIAPEPFRIGQLVLLAIGISVYLMLLGLGLAALSGICNLLAGPRGQTLLLGSLILPGLIAPAWPELPTFWSICAGLLDACLALGDRW